ncbi:cystatin-A-like [Pholidichthys leucotaenia]
MSDFFSCSGCSGPSQEISGRPDMPVLGGFGEVKPADEEIDKICEKVKDEALKSIGNAQEFKPVEYRSQVVAGTNYIIKVHTGGETYVHLKVFEDLRGGVDLCGIQTGKKKEDQILSFEIYPPLSIQCELKPN